MSGIGGVTVLRLQEAMEADLVRERIDGVDRRLRWKRLKQRLGLKGIGCFGATSRLAPSSNMTVRGDDDDDVDEDRPPPQQDRAAGFLDDVAGQAPLEAATAPGPGCAGRAPAVVAEPVAEGMNLAAALAAERNLRAAEEGDGWAATPRKASLMRLLEETDSGDAGEIDRVCCVCMVRKKGAALIPCGHTFCRVCSRELWLNRGSCPLCNRPILEILDIF